MLDFIKIKYTMQIQHYSTKYGYIDEDDNEQTGAGIMKTFKPLMKTVGKELLKGGARLLGNKVFSMIADKLTAPKAVNYQPDTMLAIAQNARKKVFEDLNIIPKKQPDILPSKELTKKVLNPGFTDPPVRIEAPTKINHMMIGTGANISKLKKKKILTKMKFYK